MTCSMPLGTHISAIANAWRKRRVADGAPDPLQGYDRGTCPTPAVRGTVHTKAPARGPFYGKVGIGLLIPPPPLPKRRLRAATSKRDRVAQAIADGILRGDTPEAIAARVLRIIGRR